MKYLILLITAIQVCSAGYRPLSTFKQGPDYFNKKKCESISKQGCLRWSGVIHHHEYAILKPIYKNGDPITQVVDCPEVVPVELSGTAPVDLTDTVLTSEPEVCIEHLGYEQIDTGRKRVGIDKVKKAEYLAAKQADKDAIQAVKDATMALKQKLKFTEPDLTPDQIKKIFRYLLRNLK
jgi:hypothetical protein